VEEGEGAWGEASGPREDAVIAGAEEEVAAAQREDGGDIAGSGCRWAKLPEGFVGVEEEEAFACGGDKKLRRNAATQARNDEADEGYWGQIKSAAPSAMQGAVVAIGEEAARAAAE
jgi:hypothetical protein